MKIVIITILVGAFTLFSQEIKAQNNTKIDSNDLSNIILVRLVETTNSAALESEIIVYYGHNKFEKIELNNITIMKGYPITNLEKVFIVINRLYENKYELITTYQSGGAVNFIFKKKN